MRATIDLSPELYRKAKARAEQNGETLKALLARAVAAELGEMHDRPSARRRVDLPLFGDSDAPAVRVTAADLERVLAHDDALRAVRRPRRGRR